MRGASSAWKDLTGGDIAAGCILIEIGLVERPEGGQQASSLHLELTEQVAASDPNPITLESAWLYADEPHSADSPVLQDRYVFLALDHRFVLPPRIWYAESDCIDEPEEIESPAQSQEQQ